MLRLSRTVQDRTLREVAKEIWMAPATLLRIEQGKAFDVATFMKLLDWLIQTSS